MILCINFERIKLEKGEVENNGVLMDLDKLILHTI